MKKRLLIMLCVCALPVIGNAQTIHNFNVAAGDWSDATNWDTGITQVDGDSAFINNDGEATLTSPTAVLLDIGVGQGVDSIGSLVHTEGTISSADGWIRIGGDGGTGVYSMSGTAALAATHMSGDQRVFVGNGVGGNGMADMTDAASITTDGEVVVGTIGAVGILEMAGDSVINATNAVTIGEGGADMGNPLEPGMGTLNMVGGATINTGGFNIGKFETGQGEVTMNGSAQILVNGWLNLGDSASVPDGVKLATLNINDDSVIMSDNINMGNSAIVVVNQDGGSVTSNNWIGMSNFGGGAVTYNLSAGSLTSLADVVTVGEDGEGTLNVSGTGDLDVQGLALIVGRNDGGIGTMNVRGSLASITATDFQLDLGATSVANLNFVADAGGVTPVVSADNTELGDSVNLSVDLANLAGWVSSGSGTSTTELVLIDNGAAVVGEFVGLAEGATVPGTNGATLTYAGGADGFDVVLQDIPITSGGPTIVVPSSFEITAGVYASGTAADLETSDNVDVSGRRSSTDIQSRVFLEVKGVSPSAAPTALSITVEASVFARTNVLQRIDLWDYDAGAWEEVDSRNAARFADATAMVDATGDLSRFVEAGTNCIQARVRYQSQNPRQQFSANTDQVIWTIE